MDYCLIRLRKRNGGGHPIPMNMHHKSHIPTIRTVTAVLLLAVTASLLFLFTHIALNDQVTKTGVLTEQKLTEPKGIKETEQTAADAPAGVIKTYTFTLGDEIPYDTSLGFYTVHQYVTVWLDDRVVYSLTPSGQQRMTKTVGSNWVMIPLQQKDAGKTVKAEITPVYESFRNRKVDFVLGSPLAIYRDRLQKDLPELVLSGLAVLTGVLFLGIAGYGMLQKRKGSRLASLGLFSIMLGVWRMFDTRFTPFMDFGKPVLVYYISTVMTMFAILPLFQWTKTYFTGKGRKVLDIYGIGALILCLVQMFLQFFGMMDIRENLVATHIALAAGVVCLLAVLLYERKYVAARNGKRRKLPPEIRLACICVAGIFGDIVAFYIKGNSSGLVYTLLAFLIYIICMGFLSMNRYTEQQTELAKLDRQLAEQNRKLTDSRIKAMMSQIRSHFIFNVLATISTYCKIDPEEADHALICFSRYLRRNIQNIEEDGLIDFTTELEQVKDYVELEKLRFMERIRFETEIGTTSFQIPPLTIQPLVENAIKHGIIEQGRSGTITLHTERDAQGIRIMIGDDGAGFDTALLEKSESVGIRNVRYRISHMTGGTMEIKSTPGKGTAVTIRIPEESLPDREEKRGEPCI